MLVGEKYRAQLRSFSTTERHAKWLVESCGRIQRMLNAYSNQRKFGNSAYFALAGKVSHELYPVLSGGMFGMDEVNEAFSGGLNIGALEGASVNQRNNAAVQVGLLAAGQCLWSVFLMFEDVRDKERRWKMGDYVGPFVVAVEGMAKCVTESPQRGELDVVSWKKSISEWDEARADLIRVFEAGDNKQSDESLKAKKRQRESEGRPWFQVNINMFNNNSFNLIDKLNLKGADKLNLLSLDMSGGEDE